MNLSLIYIIHVLIVELTIFQICFSIKIIKPPLTSNDIQYIRNICYTCRTRLEMKVIFRMSNGRCASILFWKIVKKIIYRTFHLYMEVSECESSRCCNGHYHYTIVLPPRSIDVIFNYLALFFGVWSCGWIPIIFQLCTHLITICHSKANFHSLLQVIKFYFSNMQNPIKFGSLEKIHLHTYKS